MIKVLAQLFKVCLAALFAACILSAFSMFYYYSGIHRPNPSGATDYLWEPYQLIVDRQEGNAVLRCDADGFNNPSADFSIPIANLMMGDSHMHAAHVAADESASAILNELCPERYTYNIALGGHHIYTCVNNLENALRKYKPTTSVLIDVSTVALDLGEMRTVIDGKYVAYPSYNTGLQGWLQTWLPAFKLIYKQITGWIGKSTKDSEKVEMEAARAVLTTEYKNTLNAFLNMASAAAARHGVQLIIFYIPTVKVEPGGGMVCQTDPEMLTLFADTCKKNGILFLDMTEDFDMLYEQEHRVPYGYANTEVGKAHMNKYGYLVVARRLAQVLNGL